MNKDSTTIKIELRDAGFRVSVTTEVIGGRLTWVASGFSSDGVRFVGMGPSELVALRRLRSFVFRGDGF